MSYLCDTGQCITEHDSDDQRLRSFDDIFYHNAFDSGKSTRLRTELFSDHCCGWFHFVTNASVTSQTGEEGLPIRICRRRLSIFGHGRRLPEATPAHSALRLAVDTPAGGKPDIRPEWKRQRGRPCRTWVQQIEDDTGSTPTTPGGSHVTESLGGCYDPWPVKRSTD